VAYQRALELTQNRYNGGLTSRAEVAQARTQLETTRAADIGVGVSRATYQHAIATLLGRTPESLTLPQTSLNYIPPVIPVAFRRSCWSAARYRGRRAPYRRGQRTDRHCAGGFFPAVAAHRDGRLSGQHAGRLAELAEPHVGRGARH